MVVEKLFDGNMEGTWESYSLFISKPRPNGFCEVQTAIYALVVGK